MLAKGRIVRGGKKMDESSLKLCMFCNNHVIDFENTSIIDKGTFTTRKTLKAWHARVTANADNKCCLLPGQYNIFFFYKNP